MKETGKTSHGNVDNRAICNKTITEIAVFTIQYITHCFFRVVVLRNKVASIKYPVLTESEKITEASTTSLSASIHE